MKNEDIIVEAAKRTLVEFKEQVKSSPPVVIPFAVVGLLFSNWLVSVVVIIFMFAWEGYEQYKEILVELADDSTDEVQVHEEPEVQEERKDPTDQKEQ